MGSVIEAPSAEHPQAPSAEHPGPLQAPAGRLQAGWPAHNGGPTVGYASYQAAPPAQQGRLVRVMERLWTHPAWFAPLALLTCFAGFSALMLANDPTDGRAEPFTGCALKALTGFDCPGCGGTRAFWYLVHGNLPEAARHHIFAVFAAPFLVYLYLAWASQRIFARQLPALRLAPGVIGGFFVAWGVFAVLRNLPWEPFTYFYV